MKPNEILDVLGMIDERFIDEASTKTINKNKSTTKIIKFIIPLVASLSLVFTAVTFWRKGIEYPITHTTTENVNNNENVYFEEQNTQITVEEELTTEESHKQMEYTLFINNNDLLHFEGDIALEGHFWKELNSEEIKNILPVIGQKYEFTSNVHYTSKDNVANIYHIYSESTSIDNQQIKITISPKNIEKDYIIEGESILSEIEGISILANLYITMDNREGNQNYIYYADFEIDDVYYYIEFVSENKQAENDFTRIVADIILGGKADLSIFENPIIPDLIDKELSEQEVYNEEDFGKYIINVPNDYSFNNAYRWLNQNTNSLYTSWSKGYNDISISVYPIDKNSTSRILSPKQTELYDMSLYPIPWVDSMPSETRDIIQNPIFNIKDLTVEIIEMRGYINNEDGDPSGSSLKINFSVLCDDVVIYINTEGISAEYLYDQLVSLDGVTD